MEPTKALNEEIEALIYEDPDITVFSLNQILKDKDFAIEDLTPAQTLATMSIKASDIFSGNNDFRRPTKQYSQIVPTGNYQYVKNIISEDQFKYISGYARDFFSRSSKAPLCKVLSTEDSINFQDIISSIVSNVISSNAKRHEFEDISVIGSRCFLRRTYPLSHNQFKGNINNQNWHQDSNLYFNTMPMATIWIPLDKGCGYECPGLDISSFNVNNFIPTLGDGCETLPEVGTPGFETPQEPEIASPNCDLLDGIAFNGLTFHRTSYSDSMYKSRDVFLIRIAPSNIIKYFPGSRKYDFSI
jgi:hypothetical protein